MQDFWRGRKYKKNRNNLETFYGIRVNNLWYMKRYGMNVYLRVNSLWYTCK